jgi:hypothetical protein
MTMTLDPITLKFLQDKKTVINAVITGYNTDIALLSTRKTTYTNARDKINGIIQGTITGDAAIAALAEVINILE